ncbi:hypothetical protein [Hydrogenophaga sp.]|uniref:hypothetical protein n=1 Tax=Hydrogenophaga sp. TaxID=1904254 RepID=UPI00272F49AB|nr:hypothetical protein [Hydrogenophaga sp.]MDP2074626.1 hypothetical protein [Hydrogenophaga sp.]MDP3106405.1 hypothetical protein [Hydrogenophaga sp.]
MCTGLEIAALVGTTASVKQGLDARKDAKAQSRKADAAAAGVEAERKAAETKATQDAYASTKFARDALRSNSLFTGGGTAGAQQTLGV